MSDETTSAPTGDSGVDFDAMFTTEPTPTETAPAAASEAPSASPAAEAPESTGPARDASGRFAPKAAEPAAPADGAQPEAPKAEPRPFQYRAAGETKAWDGVTEQPDGSVVVPADRVGDLRAALNARVLAEGQFVPTLERYKAEHQRLTGELQRVQQAKTVESQQASALVQAFGRVLDPTMDDGQAVEAFFNLRGQWPTLLAEAKAEFYKQQIAAPQRPQAAPPETARAEPQAPALPSVAQAWQTTQEYVEQLKLDPTFRDVSGDDWKQIVGTLERTPLAFVRPASEDEAQYPGEVVFDVDALHAHLSATVTRQREARETAARQAKLAADNARKTQPSVAAPPTVGRTATPLAPERTKLESPEDVDAWLFGLTA